MELLRHFVPRSNNCLTPERNRGGGFIEDVYLDAGFAEKLLKRIIGVFGKNNHSFYPGIDHHLGTEDAGGVGAVNGAAVEADAVQGGLDDDILFRVNRAADFGACPGGDVLRVAQTTQFQAIFNAGRGAVEAGGEDMLVFDRHRAHMVPETGAALGNYRSDFQEIFIGADSGNFIFHANLSIICCVISFNSRKVDSLVIV